MPTTQDSLLDLIPGARAAMDYVIKQVATFQRVPGRLQTAKGNLINAKRAAEAKGRLGVATEAAIAISAADNLQSEYNQISVKVGQVLEELRSQGMLAGTLDTIGHVVDAASQVAAMLSSTNDLERNVSSISSRAMTAQEQAQYQTPYASSLGKYLIFGTILYGGLWALRRGKGTRKF